MRVEPASTVSWLASRVKLPPLKIPPVVKLPARVKVPVGRGDFSLGPTMWLFLAILACPPASRRHITKRSRRASESPTLQPFMMDS